MNDEELDDYCERVEDALARWDYDAADALLRESPQDLEPWVLYCRAVLAEFRGAGREADALYGRAHGLDPEGCPMPVRMADGEALALLRSIVEQFPDDVRAVMNNLRIDLLEVPDLAIDAGPDTDPFVLGLYHGVPISEQELSPLNPPETVRIFKRNIERLAADRDELIEQLRITLLHEVGHHLGWDEDDLEARGLA